MVRLRDLGLRYLLFDENLQLAWTLSIIIVFPIVIVRFSGPCTSLIVLQFLTLAIVPEFGKR
jgi:hypothetical protein